MRTVSTLSVTIAWSLKAMMRQAAVQWVSSRQVTRHRLLPLAAASHTVFPAA